MSNYGFTLKKIRKSRGLSREDIACKEISASHIWKFENDASDITFKKLRIILKRLGMSLREFEYLSEKDSLQHYLLINKVSERYNNNDEKTLIDLLKLEESKALGQENFKISLNILIIKGALRILNPAYDFSIEEVDYLIDYLHSIDEWAFYELRLYAISIDGLPKEAVKSLTNSILENRCFTETDTVEQKLLLMVLINTIFFFNKISDLECSRYYLKFLKDLSMNETDLMSRLLSLFILGEIEFLEGEESVGKKKMRDVIKSFEIAGSFELAKSYRKDYKNLISKSKI